jgi:hypothetical protein
MINDSRNIITNLELNVKISVASCEGYYSNLVLYIPYDDRYEFTTVFNLNNLKLEDRRFIKVRMVSDECDDIGNKGIDIKLGTGYIRRLLGDRCNYIPYQLLENRKDGDEFDYIIYMPCRVLVKLHVTCQQDLSEYDNCYKNKSKYISSYTDDRNAAATIDKYHKSFADAVNECKNNGIILFDTQWS